MAAAGSPGSGGSIGLAVVVHDGAVIPLDGGQVIPRA
jgi:hypothetical protein